MCNKKYMAVDSEKNGGDEFVEYFDTLEEANYAAAVDWNRLDRWQKKWSHIFVAWVTRDDLSVDDLDEDELNDKEWWKYCNSWQTNEYCFDSEKGSKTMIEEFNRLASVLYDFIYEEEENNKEIEEIANGYTWEFDELMKQEKAKEFISQAAKERRDFYSSDREAAAAAMAYRLLIERD